MAIHPTAIIDRAASIHPTVDIGPHVIVEGPVRIGPRTFVAASVVILGNTEIGTDCRIHSHAVIGDVPQDHAYEGRESYCRIGNNCTIREAVTIHRGTAPGSKTVIGDDCLLMPKSHVGHNCDLGAGVTMMSGALLGGHVHVGARAMISDKAAVHQFVRVGELALLSELAMAAQDVPPFTMTDRHGRVAGANQVGLLEAGCSFLDLREIKAAIEVIYRSGNDHKAAIAFLSAHMFSEAAGTLIRFLSAMSKRGITGHSFPAQAAA